VVELVGAQDYETARTRLVDESRHRSAQHVIYLLGRNAPEMETLVTEIYRCQEVVRRYRNEPDGEVKDYCQGQSDRAERLAKDLQQQIKRSLAQGSFIFHGQITAVDSLDQDVLDASKKYLADVAVQVFDRYSEAPVRAETALAEKLLRAGNLNAVTTSIDPLGLVLVRGGRPNIQNRSQSPGEHTRLHRPHGDSRGQTADRALHRCPLRLVARYPALSGGVNAAGW
jgi:hypothetical protein